MTVLENLYTTISSFLITIWTAVVNFFASGLAHPYSIAYVVVLLVAAVIGWNVGKVLLYALHRRN